MDNPIRNKHIESIFKNTVPEYASQEIALIKNSLDQYQIFLNQLTETKKARQVMNSFFLSLNSIIIGVIGYSIKELTSKVLSWVLILPIIVFVLLCCIWLFLLRANMLEQDAQTEVLSRMEKYLPFTPMLNYCESLNKIKWLKNPSKIKKMDSYIPLLFCGIYIFFGVSLFIY